MYYYVIYIYLWWSYIWKTRSMVIWYFTFKCCMQSDWGGDMRLFFEESICYVLRGCMRFYSPSSASHAIWGSIPLLLCTQVIIVYCLARALAQMYINSTDRWLAYCLVQFTWICLAQIVDSIDSIGISFGTYHLANITH